MAKITYVLHTFNATDAAAGKLCVMVSSANAEGQSTPKYVEGSTISNGKYESNVWEAEDDFGGAGICRFKSPNIYTFVVDSVVYSFDSTGSPASLNARGWKLVMGEVADIKQTPSAATASIPRISTVGNTAFSRVKTETTITRAGENSPEITEAVSVTDDTASLKNITSLNARDEFAVNALKSLLQHEPNASTFSDNEIAFYCNVAYQYAANMMAEAANARSITEDETKVRKSELSNNTEKLLFEMDESLDATALSNNVYWYHDAVSPTSPHPFNAEQYIRGEYTDNAASTLPKLSSDGEAVTVVTCDDIEDAEEAGWEWRDGVVANRVLISDDVSIRNAQDITLDPWTHEEIERKDIPFTIQGAKDGALEIKNYERVTTGGSTLQPLEIDVNNPTRTVNNQTESIPLQVESTVGHPIHVEGTPGNPLEINVKNSTETVGGVTRDIPLVVKGNRTYTPQGGTAIPDVLNVNVVDSKSSVDLTALVNALVSAFSTQSSDLQDIVSAIQDLAEGGWGSSMPVQTISDFSNELTVGKYYYCNVSIGSAFTIYLPTAPSKANIIMVCLQTTSGTTPGISVVNNNDSASIRWRDSHLTTLDGGTTYELDIVYNGHYWIVGAAKIVS